MPHRERPEDPISGQHTQYSPQPAGVAGEVGDLHADQLGAVRYAEAGDDPVVAGCHVQLVGSDPGDFCIEKALQRAGGHRTPQIVLLVELVHAAGNCDQVILVRRSHR